MSAKAEFVYTSSTSEDPLYEDGPVIEVEITAPISLVRYLQRNGLPPFPVTHGYAILDTGAAMTAVDSAVSRSLDIPSVDTEIFQTAHGLAEMPLFNASANFPNLQSQGIILNRIPGGSIRSSTSSGPEIIMLLGRDLLRWMSFTYDGPRSRLTIEV